jgi:hypothetical protein
MLLPTRIISAWISAANYMANKHPLCEWPVHTEVYTGWQGKWLQSQWFETQSVLPVTDCEITSRKDITRHTAPESHDNDEPGHIWFIGTSVTVHEFGAVFSSETKTLDGKCSGTVTFLKQYSCQSMILSSFWKSILLYKPIKLSLQTRCFHRRIPRLECNSSELNWSSCRSERYHSTHVK